MLIFEGEPSATFAPLAKRFNVYPLPVYSIQSLLSCERVGFWVHMMGNGKIVEKVVSCSKLVPHNITLQQSFVVKWEAWPVQV